MTFTILGVAATAFDLLVSQGYCTLSINDYQNVNRVQIEHQNDTQEEVVVRSNPTIGEVNPDGTPITHSEEAPAHRYNPRYPNYEPVRANAYTDPHPYRTSASFAEAASQSLRAFEFALGRLPRRVDGDPIGLDANKPEFTRDIGRVAISLAEMLLRIGNPAIRRDFVSTFMGFLSARELGYVLDYDAIPDLMEIWRGLIRDTSNEGVVTQAYTELLSTAFDLMGETLTQRMRVPVRP